MPTDSGGGYTAVRMDDMGSLSCGSDWVTCAGILELDGSPGHWLAQRASWINASLFLSLSFARLYLLCLRSLFLLGGREELTTASRTWIVSLLFCTLVLGTGLQTLERGVGILEGGRLELKPRSTGDIIKGRSRTRIITIHNIVIPGHCLVIPGHCLLIIPGHWVTIFFDDCLSGRDMRWLVRMRVMDP